MKTGRNVGGRERHTRACPRCGYEYPVSKPACPSCGRPALSGREAYAGVAPKFLLFVGLAFFAVWTFYVFMIGPERYEEYRGYFFYLPRTASLVAGPLLALAFLALTVLAFRPRRGPR